VLQAQTLRGEERVEMTQEHGDAENAVVRRLERLEAENRRSRRWVATLVVGSLMTLAFGAQAQELVWTVFRAGTPASASEVNDNFALLRSWLEGKVGGVEDADVRAPRDVLAQGALRAGGDLHIGANELVFDPGEQGAGGRALVRGVGDSGKSRLHINSAQGFDRTQVEGDLEVTGTLRFSRQNCVARVAESTWIYCQNNEFVAGIDFDHNSDRVGGVYCCQF
jgi:hypothetical protein